MFCGSSCFTQHTLGEDKEVVVCPGIKVRIPGHDPVPGFEMHFGNEKKTDTTTMDHQASSGSEVGDQLSLLSPPVSPVRSQKRKEVSNDRVPQNLCRVLNECLVDGVRLRFQRMGQGRRTVNRTNYDMVSRKIKWTVEFVFEADGVCGKYLSHDVPEDTVIESALMELVLQKDFQLPESLSRFQSCARTDVRLFHVSGQGFMDVEPGWTVKQANIANRSVLEFPTFVITPKEQDGVIKYVIDGEDV